MKKGLLIVVSGPSGVGKGTVLNEFVHDPVLNIGYSISMTTRPIREGEKEGVNYFYRSKEEFMAAVDRGELLEYAEYNGNYYGTPAAYVEELRNKGINVLLEIEGKGAKQVKEKCPECVNIFMAPPSFEELGKRLRGRGTETEEVILERLAIAEEEMKNAFLYKYVITNEKIATCAKVLRSIIEAHMEE